MSDRNDGAGSGTGRRGAPGGRLPPPSPRIPPPGPPSSSGAGRPFDGRAGGDGYDARYLDEDDGAYDDEYADGYEDGDEYDEDGRPVLYDDDRQRSNRRPLIIGIAALALLAIAVVVILSLGDDEEPEAAFSLGAAAAKAARVERVAYELSVRLGGRIVTTAEGVLETGSGSQQVIVSPTSRDAVPQQPGFVLDAIAKAVYVESSVFAPAGLTFERPYVRIDLDQLGDGVTLDTEALVARFGGNPLDVLELLGETAAQDLGPETIDEEPVQHFRAELTLEALLDANPALRALLRVEPSSGDDQDGDDQDGDADEGGDGGSGDSAAPATTARAATSPTPGTGRGTGATTLTSDAPERGDDEETVVVDVYVTEDNVVRRLVFATSVSGAAIATVTFVEYDGDAQVRVPPSDEVIDLADAFGR